MQRTTLAFMFILLIIVGSVWLQFYLSKRQNKWLGLIIPVICFMFSIMTVFSLSMYSTIKTTSVTETMDGIVVDEKIVESNTDKPSIGEMLVQIIPVFLLTNISTLLFLAIYFACREKRKKNFELDMMNIQDLD